MRVDRDLYRMEYVVRIHKDELNHAFESKENFWNFLREITINTVGEEMADELFLINEEGTKMIIDVSSYQGKIDWAAVSKTGVEGVILRSTTKNGKLDTRLLENYNGILQNMNDKLNMLSFYKFSYARTFEEGAIECFKTLMTLRNAGIRKEAFDVFFLDLEAWDGRDYTTKEASAVILGYIEMCDKLGVMLGLYSNYNYLKNIIDPVWSNLPLWYARYNTYMGNIDPWKPQIWQYSNEGKIDGIKGNVDINKRV